jgi:SAM-dependent methyltransferase
VCASRDFRIFHEIRGIPVQDGMLWPTREAALAAPVGDIRLAFCGSCGYIGNLAFDAGRIFYDPHYDISLHYSPLYANFIESLADRLVRRHGLHGRRIVEIGCGKGDFLREVCRRGPNRGVGYDPTFTSEEPSDRELGVVFERRLFTWDPPVSPCDLLCCRHVVESLPDPLGFVRIVRQSLGSSSSTPVYFEVPNADTIFTRFVVWNVTYESNSYFGPASLRFLFEASGFEPLDIVPCFADEYLGIDAVATDPPPGGAIPRAAEVERLGRAVAEFDRRWRELRGEWTERLDRVSQNGERCVAWGAGGRAITFLSTVPTATVVQSAVDINPHRQGLYIPCTGQQVVAPSALADDPPDVIIITNPAFEAEIRASVEAAGLRCRFLVL